MKEIRRNMTLLLVLIALAFAGLAAYLVWTVRDHGEAWRSSAYNPRLYRQRTMVEAGDILDRNGTALAVSDGAGNRVYPQGTRAVCHAVGDPWGYSPAGAETVFGPLLLGLDETEGEKFLRLLRGGAPQGLDVTLTVDLELQRAATGALDGRRGAAVVMDYTTGEILCMVSSPGFDPARAAESAGEAGDEAAPLVNRALQGRYAPGSIFKLVTAAAALEAGWDPLTVIACTGELDVAGGAIACGGGSGHGRIDMYEAFARSCNTYFGTLGVELGAEALRAGAERLGFNRDFDFDGVRLSSSAFTLEEGDGEGDIARAAIGQHEDLVTPLHMAMLAGAVANGGVMVKPGLLLAAGGRNRLRVEAYGQVMSPGTADVLAEMMARCVAGGTGAAAALPGVTVAGKTGTAQVSDSGEGESHAWFIGYIADGDHPLCVAVVMERAGSGGATAAPAAAVILGKALELGY